MVVKDKMTKINEPLELTVTTTALTFDVPSVSSVPIGSRSGNLVVSTNGSDVANSLKIQGYDDYGLSAGLPHNLCYRAHQCASSHIRRLRREAV